MTLEANIALNGKGASTSRAEPDTYLAGASETAGIMRAFGWTASPLGPVANWPQGLKTAVRIMLTSRYAMWMGWGDELTFLYNDAYARMTLGAKHPWALGKPANVVWAEIWNVIGPRIDQVIESGEATWDEALMLFLERSGYPEETYHTFSYSPLADDTGKIAGMLCVVTEDTERVIGERRLTALRELGVALAAAGTQEEVFSAVQRCAEERPRDMPFVLTYLLDPDDRAAAGLVMKAGVPDGHPIAAASLHQGDPASPWPVESALRTSGPIVVEDLDRRFADIPRGPWDKAPKRAVVVPLAQQGQAHAAGFLVVGLNPYREFDDEYRGFIVLLANQVAASLANAYAYEEERKRSEALAELDRAKTAFFSNISHEFRTPLTLMLGPMEDVLAERNPPLPPEQRERLETAYRNTVRLLKLANNLLDFTRIEAGRMQASFQATDLTTVTADLASAFRSAMERAGLRFEVNCPPLPEPVYVDHDMWEKIVLNLLSNAFKYTLRGGVTVSLEAIGANAVLTVRDTGTGIPEKDLSRVFERFHRVEGARGRTHEGTGIGLALVQELVRLHGGDVRAESAYGAGTTFTVEIPFGAAHLPADRIGPQTGTLASTALSAESYAREALHLLPDGTVDLGAETSLDPGTMAAARARPDLSTSARLVVADDNADMRAYITRLLSDIYEVETVTNGREALNAVLRRRPDLVVSDVMMPEMDGMELLAALRARPETATIPIVLLSARAGDDARVEGLHAGADDYLVKPFSKRELLARVATLLQLSRLRSEAAETAERFRAAFESATAGLAVSDLDGRFVEANAAFCDMVGYDLEELLSLNRLALTHPDDRAGTERHIADLATGAVPHTVAEKRYVRKDGRDVWVQSSVAVVRNGRGEPHRLLSLSHDITERVQMREERELVIQSLQRERARLTEQQERQAVTLRYLRAVTLASKRLMQADSEEQIASILASTMGNDFSARICGVWLSRANNRRLVLAANSGLSAAPSRSLEPEIDVSLNAYIVGWAARFNRPFVSRTLDNKLLFDGPWLEANRITSVVILPLSFQDRVLGVLAAFFDSDLPLEASEVLSTLASVAAASLHSRRESPAAVLEAAK